MGKFSYLDPGVQCPNLTAEKMGLDLHLGDNDQTAISKKISIIMIHVLSEVGLDLFEVEDHIHPIGNVCWKF